MRRRRLLARARRLGPVLALLVVAAVARGLLLERQGLWTDEYFSLAMATGHSLEHRAADADPARGDFVEHAGPVAPREYARLLEVEPTSSLARVVDAVRRSDTNPPLYDVALALWLRAFGASDLALRGFTALAALAALPLVAWLARRAAGPRAVLPACALYALLPTSLHYGTEGRMYGLLLLLTTATLALALHVHRRGVRPLAGAALVLATVAGLLTHHFFVFVAAAVGGWLLLEPGRARRSHVALAIAAAAALAAPWYAQVPELLAGWRVTAGWLEVRPGHHRPLLSPLKLPWSLLSLRGPWGGRADLDLLHALPCLAALALGATAALRARSAGLRLAALAAAAPPLGVIAVDQLLGTYAVHHPRYALAALPALVLLVAAGLARLRGWPRALLLAALLAGCAVGARRLLLNEARGGQPYREVARLAADLARDGDLLLVHSIPSGVAGLAREVERASAGAPGPAVAAWVGQLGRRRAKDLPGLVAGARRVLLVEVHTVGDDPVPRTWLERRARRVAVQRRGHATLTVFELRPEAK